MRCTLNCNWRGVQCTEISSGEESCHAAIFHPFPAWQSDAMPSTQMFFTILKYRLKDRNTSNVFQYIAMKYCTLRSILLKLFLEDSSCLYKSAVLFLRDTLSTFWHYTLSVNNPGDRKHVGFGKFWSENDMKMSFHSVWEVKIWSQSIHTFNYEKSKWKIEKLLKNCSASLRFWSLFEIVLELTKVKDCALQRGLTAE